MGAASLGGVPSRQPRQSNPAEPRPAGDGCQRPLVPRIVEAILPLRRTVNARLLHRRQSVEERQAAVSNWPMQKSIPIPSRQALFLYRVSHRGFSLLFVPILPNTPV